MLNATLYDALPSIIESIGQADFYDSVLSSIQSIEPISNTKIVCYSKKKPPYFLGDCVMSDIDKVYCQQAYLLDPIYDEIYGHEHHELVTLDSLVSDSFCNSVYYDLFYHHLGWQNETNFVVGTNDDTKICIVYTTDDNHASIHQALVPYLKSIKAAIKTHESFRQQMCHLQTVTQTSLPNPHLRYARFDHFNLTKREREIVTLILQGLTSIDIAEKCFVSEGTVKNHRKNIYRKLSIKSQAELFHQFIQ
ncbi:helix-turn-helix transcriptional regulator [Marinomonas sp. A79]|uniref:Helix-turn-helix transcriptional regulator n=1 Tax=Marinomonas vulgaris TaxID=2823372 RepID=A0ABS5HF48_9GAMM|nr:LuxR C-terminal-related transcriptional regulator [Marinomonas vulgaris]MBR7890043.1 helix-turn-helix transcriptional regulator [Marinomonas vulgaris]